jgi:tRNA-splicing ligase RtcB
LAQVHITKARNLFKDGTTPLEDPDLAYFLQGTPEFDAYIGDMLWAQDYALANREQMMDNALRVFFGLNGRGSEKARINCHHNFSNYERHGDNWLWITRKGAIQADKGRFGVIPGSMGTRSYIVEGLGNPESWNSCSHGAGRRMSRNQAKKLLTKESLAQAMEGKNWQHDKADQLVDEHPAAYKDIDRVMEDQKDLVQVVHTLRQIANYKGTN